MMIPPELINGLFALGGAVIAGIPQFASAWLGKRSEERKQLKELAVKAATESWKMHIEHARPNAKFLPLEVYIIHTTMMCDFALSDAKVDPESMRKHLDKVQSVMDVMVKHASTPSK